MTVDLRNHTTSMNHNVGYSHFFVWGLLRTEREGSARAILCVKENETGQYIGIAGGQSVDKRVRLKRSSKARRIIRIIPSSEEI